MRWRLLDEVLEIQYGKFARSLSRVPAMRVSSQVLMIEMMAQTGALVLGAQHDFRQDVVFAKIAGVRFFNDAPSGAEIIIRAAADGLRPEGAWFDATVGQADRLLAEGRLMIMNVGHLLAGRTEPVSFHRVFMDHYRIREKVQK